MQVWKVAAPVAALALALTGCSSGQSTTPSASGSGGVSGSLTVWNYGALDDSSLLTPLVAGFKAKYPDVTVNLVGQPADNYYALLQAAVVSGRGPDVFSMFPGGYQKQFQEYSLDLSDKIPQADLTATNAQYYSANGGTTSQVYGVPSTAGMYMMLYNKKVLADAGVASVPTTWDELDAACAKVVAAGKTCLGYGSQDGSGGFSSYLDWSYLVGAAEPLTTWDKLIAGTEPYSSPTIVDQVTRWGTMHEKGWTNPDVLTWRNVRTSFESGDVAMVMGGSWDSSWAQKALGADVAAAPAPFSPTPNKLLVQLPDNGYSISKEAANPTAAVAFAAYVVSGEGQAIVAKAGNVPSRSGVAVTDPVNNALLTQAKDESWTVVPMFDNFIAPTVNQALTSGLNQVLAGQISAKDAMAAVDKATAGLSTSERVAYHLGGS
ncbi:MAG: extracellular solute-binding protein [Cellulomonas sp.]|nr:extracellular solute-binding protein [Cellulomonas sp.]